MSSSRLNWDDGRVFLAIARSGTLSGAAQRMGSGIATISRRIEKLETALGMRLFVRHQTGYQLTDEGNALLARAEALENAALAFGANNETDGQVIGSVRLATTESFANVVFIPTLEKLFRDYPELSLEIVTDVATVNLHRSDVDIAVRMLKPERRNVSATQIGVLGHGLYGSRAFIAARGLANCKAGFDNDCFIGWSDDRSDLSASQWVDRMVHHRRPSLLTTTFSAQISAAKAGLGLAVLPHYLALDAGLQRLPIELGIDQAIWLVVHSDLSASRRVQVVVDHLARVVREQRVWLRNGESEN